MKKIVKYITGKTLRPLLVRYLSETRTYRHNGLVLAIPSEVFHPAFFFSSKVLLRYVEAMELRDRSFLELGAGSGLTAFSAAKKGAVVTVTDINTVAIDYLKQNNAANNLQVKIILSDLFSAIPSQQFDIIAVNPPYYKKEPVTEASHAWYCGKNGEYFAYFFSGLRNYLHSKSEVIMVLSDVCDIEMIIGIASDFNFRMELVLTKRFMIEQLYIYKIIDCGTID